MSFPDKEKRKNCWDARDKYWQCLDQYAPKHQATSGQDEPAVCDKFRKYFEMGCPSQWVHHFDRKRSYDQFKQKLETGFDPITEEK